MGLLEKQWTGVESWVLVLTLLLFHAIQVAFPGPGLTSFSCITGWWLEYPSKRLDS